MRYFTVIWLLSISPAAWAEGVQIPKDVDYGASGLVQFKYECGGANCQTRCYLHDTKVMDVQDAKLATFTSYRSHNRQNAPEKEVTVVGGSPPTTRFLNFSGDGGCVFEGMEQTSTSGFLSRLTLDPKSKSSK